MATALAPVTYAPPAALPLHAAAVVFDAPGALGLRELALKAPGDADVVVDVEWSGVSAGTERLLWRGTMPVFPGMGYPLVPGYETVGRVRWAGAESGRAVGERVFLPGAYSFSEARNLFGGAAATLVAPGARAHLVGDALGEDAVLLALAATALHAVRDAERPAAVLPDLIVGHGALGRLAARLVVALGASAAQALTGSREGILKRRGTLEEGPNGLPVFLTIHPSFLLRLPDPVAREMETERFREDLRAAKDYLEKIAA